jgi:hypothetical protein
MCVAAQARVSATSAVALGEVLCKAPESRGVVERVGCAYSVQHTLQDGIRGYQGACSSSCLSGGCKLKWGRATRRFRYYVQLQKSPGSREVFPGPGWKVIDLECVR